MVPGLTGEMLCGLAAPGCRTSGVVRIENWLNLGPIWAQETMSLGKESQLELQSTWLVSDSTFAPRGERCPLLGG